MEKRLPIIATAAWSIPRAVASQFPLEGTGLSRYAAVFKGVEINSTFYRQHKPSTFERWMSAVPDDFRFAVKIPKDITHVARLEDIRTGFQSFLAGISPLAGKLGPLLCQLPPSLTFDLDLAEQAFGAMREQHAGPIAVEARHRSWACDAASQLLERFSIDRVLADPAPVWEASDFEEAPRYVRLHGQPKIYYSSYTSEEIGAFAKLLSESSWCVFDNTASGAASKNALAMLAAFASA